MEKNQNFIFFIFCIQRKNYIHVNRASALECSSSLYSPKISWFLNTYS